MNEPARKKSNEPERIGLTEKTNRQLEEILDFLNSRAPNEQALIKFDIYRLAVALGIKKGEKSKPTLEKADKAFRVIELDREKALFYAVRELNLHLPEQAIYHAVECLADDGIQLIYDHYIQNMENIIWDQLIT